MPTAISSVPTGSIQTHHRGAFGHAVTFEHRYPDRFGDVCPPYESSTHSLGFFASKTHAIGVRLDGRGLLEVVAPFGLEPMFAMRIEPNRKLQNSPAYEEKGARARTNWPEVELIPW